MPEQTHRESGIRRLFANQNFVILWMILTFAGIVVMVTGLQEQIHWVTSIGVVLLLASLLGYPLLWGGFITVERIKLWRDKRKS